MPLSSRQTVIVAILVLFVGKYLNRKIGFLREYNIPEPVSGGVIASLLFGVLYFVFDFQFDFNLITRDILLIVFFTTIGLSSKISTLIEGGKPLLILLVAAVVYLFLQNLTGIVVAAVTGLDLTVGLIGGSVSLSGGHGTTIAWAPTFVESYGIGNAMEIGIASATFGLVLGGVIGGPIAKFLINKYSLEATSETQPTVGIRHDQEEVNIDYNNMLNTILVISFAVGIGLNLNDFLATLGLQLPNFVTALFAGIILTNVGPTVLPKFRWPVNTPSLALVSDLSLGLFLAMSLMSLQLWTLIDLAGPIVLMLLAQLIIITFFVIFVIFRLMGRDYDAAVMSSGYAGLALGATPTAIANMTAVTKKFGASPRAFIVVPLVGAFFIDISNAFIIQYLLGIIG